MIVLVGAIPSVMLGFVVHLRILRNHDAVEGAHAPTAGGPETAAPLPTVAVAAVSPAPEEARLSLPPAPRRSSPPRPRSRGTKREQLRALLEVEVASDDGRSVYQLAKELAPRVELHEGTARKYVAQLLAERAGGPHLRAVSAAADDR